MVAPAGSEGIVQGKLMHPPPLTDTNVRPAPGVSSTTTFVASDGPLFPTVMLYTASPPAMADPLSVLMTPMSDTPATATVPARVLLPGTGSVTEEVTCEFNVHGPG